MKEQILKFEIRTKLDMNLSEFCKEHKISRATVSGWINKKVVISAKHVRLLKDIERLDISQDAIEKPYKIVE